MRYIWEADDFKPHPIKRGSVGMIVRRDAPDSETFIIGYMGDVSSTSGEPRYCYVSLRDGLINGPFTAEDIAARLNDHTVIPVKPWLNIEEGLPR